MFSFKFNGKSSKEFGITVLRRPPRMAPNSRLEVIEIEGAHGARTGYLGENSFTISMEIAVERKENIDKIKTWLRGKGKFERSDIKGRYMEVEQQSRIEFRMVSKDLYVANLTLQSLDPFWYKTNDRWKRLGGEIYYDSNSPDLIPSTVYIPNHTDVPYERIGRYLSVIGKRNGKEIVLSEKEPTIITTYSKGNMITLMYLESDKKIIEGKELTLVSNHPTNPYKWEGFKVIKNYSNGVIEARRAGIVEEDRLPIIERRSGVIKDKNPYYDVYRGIIIDEESIIGKDLTIELNYGVEDRKTLLKIYDGPRKITQEVIPAGGTTSKTDMTANYGTLFIGMVPEDTFPNKTMFDTKYPSIGNEATWVMERVLIKETVKEGKEFIIENEGNTDASPIIWITGSASGGNQVDITVNGTRFIYGESRGSLNLRMDCRDKECIGSRGQDKSGSVKIGYDFPKLSPGKNRVVINSGNYDGIFFKRKDRWRG